jgi:hypothetical protein
MSNEMVKAIEEERALAGYGGGGDDFDTVHEQGGSEYVRGTIITFVDKEYKDRDGHRHNDAGLVAVGVKNAWRKFVDGAFIYVPPQPNGYLCGRNSLGDLDESRWEIKFGERQDPWQNMRALFLFDIDTAKPYTFIGTSSGARHAVETLADQIILKRKLQPGVSPILKLGWALWGRQFPKSRPDFEVLEWITLSGQPEQPRRAVIINPMGGEPAHLDAPPHDHVPDHGDDPEISY